MKRVPSGDSQHDGGQALIESAIVVPFMLFIFLCLLQIMLIAHARILLDYAAFNAARAGVVHNGNPRVMRNAALLSMLPAFGRVDTPEHALETWAQVRAWAELGSLDDTGTHYVERFVSSLFPRVSFTGIFPNVSVVAVDILNPTEQDFRKSTRGEPMLNNTLLDHSPIEKEIDFDLAARLEAQNPEDILGMNEAVRKTRLTIRVQWLFMMRVPLANRVIFYLFMFYSFMKTKLQLANWRNWYMINMEDGRSIATALEGQDFAAIDLSQWPNGWKIAIRDQLMFQGLKRLPEIKVPGALDGLYLMPLFAVQSMPMESNLYRSFVE